MELTLEDKINMVHQAHSAVHDALSLINIVQYDTTRLEDKGYGVLSLLNTQSSKFEPIGILRIFIAWKTNKISYRVDPVWGSNLPFNPAVGTLDLNNDSTISTSEVINVATALINNLNK